MDLMSAINLLSNGKLKNQKVSVFKGLRALISTFRLFPLDRSRRLTADIVTNTVDTTYFINDAIGNFTQ